MGLDITVVKDAKKPAQNIIEEVMTDDSPHDAAYSCGLDIPYENTDFPGRMQGVDAVPYEPGETWGFRAGGYSGYNLWRSELARLVGIDDIKAWWSDITQCLERGLKPAKPFWELLYFSDCEGTIGPVVSKKLAADFDAWADRAAEHGDEYWRGKYNEWRRAFHDAAQNGYVSFH